MLVIQPGLLKAIEHRVTNRQAVSEQGMSYYIVPAAAGALRKRLFEMMHNDPTRRKSAQDVLQFIDRRRDEYGRPEDEPRHPDIATGLPWPPEASSVLNNE